MIKRSSKYKALGHEQLYSHARRFFEGASFSDSEKLQIALQNTLPTLQTWCWHSTIHGCTCRLLKTDSRRISFCKASIGSSELQLDYSLHSPYLLASSIWYSFYFLSSFITFHSRSLIQYSSLQQSMGLKLEIVKIEAVRSALSGEKETGQDQQEYNTKAHSLEDIRRRLPTIEHEQADPVQPWVLLAPWLDLVMSSQGLAPHDVHRIYLPRIFLDRLLLANHVAMIKGRMSESDAEDLQATFPIKTVQGKLIDQLLREKKCFIRLDTCSSKDALYGHGPVCDSKDLWTRLATSGRAGEGIKAMLSRHRNRPVYVYLLRWDCTMQPKLEYRVFCAPGSGKISAISQYKWHERWYHYKKSTKERDEIVKGVYEGIKVIHDQIMHHPAMTEHMKKRGFVFDVVEGLAWSGSLAVKLIELNDFGAMTGSGSCLFHWLKDAPLLYGLEDVVEFRVAM